MNTLKEYIRNRIYTEKARKHDAETVLSVIYAALYELQRANDNRKGETI